MESHIFKDSTNVKKADYDADTGNMVVTFHSGATYNYPNTTPDTWRKFRAAESPGGFVNRNLRK